MIVGSRLRIVPVATRGMARRMGQGVEAGAPYSALLAGARGSPQPSAS